MQADGKAKTNPKNGHYWSVMFVGDHGKVIPFRHFKALTISVFLILMLSIAANAVLGLLYFQQRQAYNSLRYDTSQVDVQSRKLRDEKDLCLAKLVALKKQFSQKLPPESIEKKALKNDKTPHPTAAEPHTEKSASSEKISPAKEVKESGVKWMADIQKFEVFYDPLQRILKLQFRIYNTSIPKKPLAGNAVVVLKKDNDPSHLWAAMPAVPLNDGKPVGDKGKYFKINNYRTERFRIPFQSNSPEYNTVDIYIFTKDAALIRHKDIPFVVDYHSLKEPDNGNETEHRVDQVHTPSAEQSQTKQDIQPTKVTNGISPTTSSNPAEPTEQKIEKGENPITGQDSGSGVIDTTTPQNEATPSNEKPAIEGGEE